MLAVDRFVGFAISLGFSLRRELGLLFCLCRPVFAYMLCASDVCIYAPL